MLARPVLLLAASLAGAAAEEACPAGSPAACSPGSQALAVNASRLWASLEAMAQVGGFPGPNGSRGVRREALTDADARGRALLDSWARELGLQREVDGMGNTYYRRKGWRRGAGTLAFGSHLDTQPSGGRFDGAYGVLAGLEVMRTLEDLGASTELDLELVNFCNEEGSRFAPPMMGSGVVMGQLSGVAAHESKARGQPGVSFGKELRRLGLKGSAPGPLARGWVAFLELHIEQGPVLEQQGARLGVVTGGQGQRTFEVEVEGFAGHSGTVPLEQRADALVCASDMVLRVRDLGLAQGVLATVGSMAVRPNSFNTIPAAATFTVDLRSPKALDAAEAALRREVAAAAQRRGCAPPKVVRTKSRPTVVFDSHLRAQLHAGARAVGVKASELFSGAGHDACHVQQRVPAAMLFVPCARGISHNPQESITAGDAALGGSALLNAVLRTQRELPHLQAEVREFYGRCTLDRRLHAVKVCGDGCDVVFLGDSIMERMNGDDLCRVIDRVGRRADNKVYRATWASHGRSVILAGKADETNHTLHLLNHVLPTLRQMKRAPKLYSLLIGTNNIGARVKTLQRTAQDIKEILRRLHAAHPSSAVLLHAILPRADNRRFHEKNQELNRQLRAFAGAQGGWLHFLDCGHVFPEERMPALMEDRLHPNPEGYRQWYQLCLRPALQRLVGPSVATA